MADIFQGLPVGPSTWTKDDGSLGRSFIAGMEIGNQRRAQALKEREFEMQNDPNSLPYKLMASRIQDIQLQNEMAQHQLNDEIESKAVIADYQRKNSTPIDWINSELPENPKAAAWVLKQKQAASNTLAGMSVIQDNINWNKSYAAIDPEDQSLIDSMKPLDNGRPSPEMRKVMSIAEEKLRMRQSAAAQEKALTAAGPLAAQIRQETALKTAQLNNDARKTLEELKLDAKSSSAIARGLTFAQHMQLNQFKLEGDLIKQLPIKKQEKAKMEFDNRWQQILKKAEQESNQSPGSSNAPSTLTIPQGAIDKLKSNPDLRSDFDAKYGAGASDSILGK